MLGTFINAGVVILGTFIGLLFKKGIPERVSDCLMKALGLCTMYIGISGSLKGENTLILIVSMVVGGLLGSLWDLDGKLTRLGDVVGEKCKKLSKGSSVSEGFVTATMIFCVGAMAIVGSLQAGLTGDISTIVSKSALDGVCSVILASTLGFGVALSSVFILIYQGGITLLAQFVAPFLTEAVIAEMTCAGSVVILGIGLNLAGITKLKVMNYTPALFLPIILCRFM